MYGSIFCRDTRYPRASSSAPIDAAASPLPSEETTPPVTKMNFGPKSSLLFPVLNPGLNVVDFTLLVANFPLEPAVPDRGEHRGHVRARRHAQRDGIAAPERRPPGLARRRK